jgi:hypothetical protein
MSFVRVGTMLTALVFDHALKIRAGVSSPDLKDSTYGAVLRQESGSKDHPVDPDGSQDAVLANSVDDMTVPGTSADVSSGSSTTTLAQDDDEDMAHNLQGKINTIITR